MAVNWADDAPDTEAVWPRLTRAEQATIEQVDADRLERERAAMAARLAAALPEPRYAVRNRFRYWEHLVRRLEQRTLGDGYLIDLYFNDLANRDSLDTILVAHPGLAAGQLGPLLAALDRRFDAATEFDGGAERRRWTSRFDSAQLSPRWLRRPRELPWEH
ncbi:hypothetical protein [Catellatospora sichuanensis]|uniref:hypothetical protein n=1 Tax=Catellatospora sichuanensis TaxID=1969805 RepID=UPI001183B877|nr:hypothetical protein [Catellatospora sichuanensis]